ncbi:MAG: hypothetical protein ACRC8S_15030 [Fimbriiglobus sp.]
MPTTTLRLCLYITEVSNSFHDFLTRFEESNDHFEDFVDIARAFLALDKLTLATLQ